MRKTSRQALLRVLLVFAFFAVCIAVAIIGGAPYR